MSIKERIMDPITIAIIAFLGGALTTGGAMWGISQSNKEKQNVEKIIESLETKFEKAQASALVNLTETDLLKIPCSMEYIQEHSDLLCREMFCRMNRQGGGQNSGGGAGAEASECNAISSVAINALKLQTCMPYWEEGAGQDQNSRYSRCISVFQSQP